MNPSAVPPPAEGHPPLPRPPSLLSLPSFPPSFLPVLFGVIAPMHLPIPSSAGWAHMRKTRSLPWGLLRQGGGGGPCTRWGAGARQGPLRTAEAQMVALIPGGGGGLGGTSWRRQCPPWVLNNRSAKKGKRMFRGQQQKRLGIPGGKSCSVKKGS